MTYAPSDLCLASAASKAAIASGVLRPAIACPSRAASAAYAFPRAAESSNSDVNCSSSVGELEKR